MYYIEVYCGFVVVYCLCFMFIALDVVAYHFVGQLCLICSRVCVCVCAFWFATHDAGCDKAVAICMYVCICIMCIHVCMYVCMYVYIYIYIYTYIHIKYVLYHNNII